MLGLPQGYSPALPLQLAHWRRLEDERAAEEAAAAKRRRVAGAGAGAALAGGPGGGQAQQQQQQQQQHGQQQAEAAGDWEADLGQLPAALLPPVAAGTPVVGAAAPTAPLSAGAPEGNSEEADDACSQPPSETP